MRSSSGGTTSSATNLTAARAARLYKLLTLLGDGPKTRRVLLTRLKVDQRGFYRDMETLRSFGIEVVVRPDTKYALTQDLNGALEKLPFPDPGLNVRDALQLSTGNTAAHRKLRQRVHAFLNGQAGSGTGGPKKPR